jgi:hypothetical protein
MWMMIINSIHALLFLCKYIAFGSKQFKSVMHPHDRPQHLNFRGELCRVFITFQYITQTLSTVLFFNHIFHFGYLSNYLKHVKE